MGLTTEGKAAEERKGFQTRVSVDDEVVAEWKAGKYWQMGRCLWHLALFIQAQNPLQDLVGALNGLRVFL